VTIQSKEKIIRALFAAYLSDNRKAVEDCFADDFRFTSPYDDRIDKATYFDAGASATGSNGKSSKRSSSRAMKRL
jgi:ketosteroid isomerase-like protein